MMTAREVVAEWRLIAGVMSVRGLQKGHVPDGLKCRLHDLTLNAGSPPEAFREHIDHKTKKGLLDYDGVLHSANVFRATFTDEIGELCLCSMECLRVVNWQALSKLEFDCGFRDWNPEKAEQAIVEAASKLKVYCDRLDELLIEKEGKIVFQKRLGLFARVPKDRPSIDHLKDLQQDDPGAEYERLKQLPPEELDSERKRLKREFREFTGPIKEKLKKLGLPHDDLAQIVKDFEEGGYNADGVPFDEVVDSVCDEVERLRKEKRRSALAERYTEAGKRGFDDPVDEQDRKACEIWNRDDGDGPKIAQHYGHLPAHGSERKKAIDAAVKRMKTFAQKHEITLVVKTTGRPRTKNATNATEADENS